MKVVQPARISVRQLALSGANSKYCSRRSRSDLVFRWDMVFYCSGLPIMLLDAMSFIHDDFLLANKAAQRLYHDYAEQEPILDYHCHLPPREVAENRRFQNLFEIWLEGDHYTWRAMRANGIGEEYCTGTKPPKEKFLAWARTVPQTLR